DSFVHSAGVHSARVQIFCFGGIGNYNKSTVSEWNNRSFASSKFELDINKEVKQMKYINSYQK
ncbi:MAG TPA: hypothetical protein PK713_04690, partial [Candidatus Cloacimonas sp.]|nr:hypothetical protein [Candidatus Cloacimonas sp.]